jgi:flagellar motor switch protein FliM
MSAEELPEAGENQNSKKDEQLLGVRRFDFRTARKLSQSQRIKLGGLHSRLAQTLAKKLEESMHVATEVTFLGLEQVQGSAFQAADTGDVITTEIPVRPGMGRLYMLWPRELAFFMIEKVLGGTGEQLFMDKELSEFEQNIIKRQTNLVFQLFQKAFDKSYPEGACEVIREGLEPFSEMLPYEILLIGRLNIKLRETQGKLTLIYPYSVIKPWLDESIVNPEALLSAPPSKPNSVPRGLARAPMSITVRIEPTAVKLSDFSNLQVGDCLELNHNTNDPFHVYIDDKLKFSGHLGLLGKQMGLKIAAKLNHPQEETH